MSTKKPALGKGLGALISDVNDINTPRYSEPAVPVQKKEDKPNPASICELPIDKITPNAMQPRTRFDEESLDELASSIRAFGLIQPVTVRPIGEKYQIISGERRYRAALRAGLETIPAYIKETDAQGMLEMAIVENIQREDLDAIEIALSYSRLIDECHLTQEQMAERIGRKRSSITNYLRLLKLPVYVQAQLRDNRISMGHAKVLLSLESPEIQSDLCKKIISRDMSVRQLETVVKNMARKKDEKQAADRYELPETYYRVADILGSYFDNSVSIKRSENGEGRLTVHFRNDREMENFLLALENIKQK